MYLSQVCVPAPGLVPLLSIVKDIKNQGPLSPMQQQCKHLMDQVRDRKFINVVGAVSVIAECSLGDI